MVIKILLIISIILQLGAASVAIGMIQKTKYNLSWMLFTVALTGSACLRFGQTRPVDAYGRAASAAGIFRLVGYHYLALFRRRYPDC